MAMKTGLEIPPEMRAFAEKSVGEARKAFETYMDAATKAFGTVEQSAQTMQANARGLGRKAIGFAEENVSATLDFAQKLVQAKDAEEVMRLSLMPVGSGENSRDGRDLWIFARNTAVHFFPVPNAGTLAVTSVLPFFSTDTSVVVSSQASL